MKTEQFIGFLLLVSGCVNAQSPVSTSKLDIAGVSLPAIRHITEMKMMGDTLLFVYESEGGYGQRFLRRGLYDRADNTLTVSSDLGKQEDGYYAAYMPYPFVASNGPIYVVGQDDCELYSINNDTSLVRSRHYLMDSNSAVPFPLSQYVQDVFITDEDQYVFIGREPNGGRQFAMHADLTAATVDTIRQLSITPDLNSWMPNTGEMAYSSKFKRLAFAYQLHPMIEIFDIEGRTVKTVRLGEDTFDPQTLDEADFMELCILHTVDLTYSPEYIYALVWNCKYSDRLITTPIIYKINWDGEIINSYTDIPAPLYRIAALDDSQIIGWNGQDFIILK